MKKVLLSVLLIVFSISIIKAQEVIWLSNTPPDYMKDRIKSSGMHRFSSLKSGKYQRSNNKKGSYKKKENDNKQNRSKKAYRPATKYIQWIRQGSTIENAKYICFNDSADYELTLISPQHKKTKIELIKEKSCYLKFEMNEEGYYNAYLITKQSLGDTLLINIAKAELLNHSCRNGHHKKLEARPVMHYPDVTEFEIIRKRHPYEDYHYFSSSGDKETYLAYYKDKPVEGVKLSLHTQKGWSKTAYTDKNGELSIEFIQDYFSKWQELNKRQIFYYLLQADYTVKKDVEYKGRIYPYVHYRFSMSDGYRPAKTMYASMVWGLIVFLIVTILSIAGVYIYKERRKKPYKELVFDESNK